MKAASNDKLRAGFQEHLKQTEEHAKRLEEILFNHGQTTYERYESTLRTVIISVLHEEGETDDVLHDVFIQRWNRADRFDTEKGVHGFLDVKNFEHSGPLPNNDHLNHQYPSQSTK